METGGCEVQGGEGLSRRIGRGGGVRGEVGQAGRRGGACIQRRMSHLDIQTEASSGRTDGRTAAWAAGGFLSKQLIFHFPSCLLLFLLKETMDT